MAPALQLLNSDDVVVRTKPQLQLNDATSMSRDHFQLLLDSMENEFERSSTRLDVDEIWRCLEEYRSKVDDWSKYAFYDPGKYKRNLVAEYEKYNVMIICWGPMTKSCIHDHAGSHCFMKVLDGELVESRFAWPEQKDSINTSQEMKRISESKMNINDVYYINDKVGLHRVENPSPSKTAASLHVYIPPYRECKAFDQSTGEARECKLNFYSKCGRIVSEDDEP